MVLHELAHAYHFQVLGSDNADVNSAWQARVDSGDYEEVLHVSGDRRRHYALTNDMEYFAETTESYFGTNDFHPFVQAELKEVDPGGYALMRSAWLSNTD
jgi:dipeptidyl-peptidase-4